LLTDARVYDWWDLASAWGTNTSSTESKEDEISPTILNYKILAGGPQYEWVRELMIEQGIRALPRDIHVLGRALDSRDFWESFGLFPVKTLFDS